MSDAYDVTPLTAQQAELLEMIRREAVFSGFEVFCAGCGVEGFTPCQDCPRAPKRRGWRFWRGRS